MANIKFKCGLSIFIFISVIRVTSKSNECLREGVRAIDINQIYVPPGFDVCVEEGSTLMIDTGIGSEVEDQICFTESMKNGSRQQIACVPSYNPEMTSNSSGYSFKVIKNNTISYRWTLKLWNIMSNPGKIDWWLSGHNSEYGSITITMLDRKLVHANVRVREKVNFSIVKYFTEENIKDIGFDGPSVFGIHYFDLEIESGSAKGCTQFTDFLISPFYAHKYLSINFWNVDCGRRGQYTLSVTDINRNHNILVSLSINENIEVDGKVLKTPTFSFDKTKVMCSANKKKMKVLWFENGVPIPERGKGGYGIERTDNSSILTIEYIDLKPNCTMEYMCWVSTDCSEGKNRTISVNISDITVCPPCNRSIECPTEACLNTRETIDYSASYDHTEIYSTNSTLCINTGHEECLLWSLMVFVITNMLWIIVLCCVKFYGRLKIRYHKPQEQNSEIELYDQQGKEDN
ncbi:uncharacterized protein [Ptychodera flava]|uniref:uncharacterized protein isoform X2 n=1 Tax=Ptychodera flava TaxID=63121 RepID=UPI00396A5277